MVFRKTVKLQSNDRGVTFHDVTDAVRAAVAESGVRDGIAVIYSRHTTCATIIEESAFDLTMTGIETLQQDLVNVMERAIPTCRTEGMYLHPGPKAVQFAAEHDENWFCAHNTDAHLRSSIIGRSETVVIVDGEADLGEFGHVYFIDWDQTRARERTVRIQIVGE